VRLPFFLEYYRAKGIGQFFILDNDSEDGTRDFLINQKDVCLFYSREQYSQALCGFNWHEILLKRYGTHRWCLTLDIDEFFVYPHSEKISIKELCVALDREGANALRAPLLDMYADGFPVAGESWKKDMGSLSLL